MMILCEVHQPSGIVAGHQAEEHCALCIARAENDRLRAALMVAARDAPFEDVALEWVSDAQTAARAALDKARMTRPVKEDDMEQHWQSGDKSSMVNAERFCDSCGESIGNNGPALCADCGPLVEEDYRLRLRELDAARARCLEAWTKATQLREEWHHKSKGEPHA